MTVSKRLPGLAVVLAGGLVGCSGEPAPVVSLNERRWLGDGSSQVGPVEVTNEEIEGFGQGYESVSLEVVGPGEVKVADGKLAALQWLRVGGLVVEVPPSESSIVLRDQFGLDVERYDAGTVTEIELDNLAPWGGSDTLYVMDKFAWFQGPLQEVAESLGPGATKLMGSVGLEGFRSVVFDDAVAYQLSYMDERLEQFGIVRVGALSGSVEGGVRGSLRPPGFKRSLELELDPSPLEALAPCDGFPAMSGQVAGGGRGVALEGGALLAAIDPIQFASFTKEIGIPLFEMSVALSGSVWWACRDVALDDDAAEIEFYRDVDGGQSLPAFENLGLPTNVLLDGVPVANISSIEAGVTHHASWDATAGACQYRVEIVSYEERLSGTLIGAVATRSPEAVLPASYWATGGQVRIEVAAAFEDCATSQLRVRQVPSDWAVLRSPPLSVR